MGRRLAIRRRPVGSLKDTVALLITNLDLLDRSYRVKTSREFGLAAIGERIHVEGQRAHITRHCHAILNRVAVNVEPVRGARGYQVNLNLEFLLSPSDRDITLS